MANLKWPRDGPRGQRTHKTTRRGVSIAVVLDSEQRRRWLREQDDAEFDRVLDEQVRQVNSDHLLDLLASQVGELIASLAKSGNRDDQENGRSGSRNPGPA